MAGAASCSTTPRRSVVADYDLDRYSATAANDHFCSMTLEPSSRQPALDGLRGLAIALVLCFHGGWPWMPGGYLGVSVFFTLSGFLITRLLLEEHARSGTIQIRRFTTRRLRRLMPASLACVSGVLTLRLAGRFDDSTNLGRDALAAVTQIANWVQLLGPSSYAEQIAGARSPLGHYWSLAIEEQFYWTWPLVMVLLLRSRRPIRGIVWLAAAATLTAPAVAMRWGGDAAYWSTPARAGEILVGAALAALTTGRKLPRRVAKVGPPALITILVCAVTWSSDRGPAYQGALPLFAIVSAALIAALLVPGRLSGLFSTAPLVRLGEISYGVYLYHWPIFLLIPDGSRPRVINFALQLALTLAVAEVSHRFLEQPIRNGVVRPRRDWSLATIATAAIVTAALTLPLAGVDVFAHPELAAGQLRPADRPAELFSTAAIARPPGPAPPIAVPSTIASPPRSDGANPPLVPPDGASARPTVPVDPTLPAVPSRPIRILVVGDSVAWSLGNGLVEWADAHPDYAEVGQVIAISCGFIRHGSVPAFDGLGYTEPCEEMLSERLPEALGQLRPDIVVLMSTRADVADRVWNEAEGTLSNDDVRFTTRQLADYVAFTDGVLDTGAPGVVWITPPTARRGDGADEPMMDEDAMQRLREIVGAMAHHESGRVSVVDLAGWYLGSGMDEVRSRPDGVHFIGSSSSEVAERFLAARLVRAALGLSADQRSASQRSPS